MVSMKRSVPRMVCLLGTHYFMLHLPLHLFIPTSPSVKFQMIDNYISSHFLTQNVCVTTFSNFSVLFDLHTY